MSSLKEKLEQKILRIVGDVKMPCQRVGLLVGGIGGENPIWLMQQAYLDVVMCGETVEWQTCEPVGDAPFARHLG